MICSFKREKETSYLLWKIIKKTDALDKHPLNTMVARLILNGFKNLLWEGGMFQENSIETCMVSRMKQITSPGWMHETSSRTWCTGKTWGERVEREVGGGIGMGNTCKPMAVLFQCMTKFTTNKKKKIVFCFWLNEILNKKTQSQLIKYWLEKHT